MTDASPPPPDGSGLAVVVLVARWHAPVTDALRDGALATLRAAGVGEEDVTVHEVPGAWELPLAATWVARKGGVDAIVALGCIVRGETPHFDVIAHACARGLADAARETGVPVGFGVITADTMAQAKARASGEGGIGAKAGNKGVEAADAALRMAALYRGLEGGSGAR